MSSIIINLSLQIECSTSADGVRNIDETPRSEYQAHEEPDCEKHESANSECDISTCDSSESLQSEGSNFSDVLDIEENAEVFSDQNEDECDMRDDQSYNTRNNRIMFEASGLTVNDVVSMVAAYCLRYGCSNVARDELMTLLKVCAGPAVSNLNISNYQFSKQFDPPAEKVTFVYYCSTCYTKLYAISKTNFRSTKKVCDFCSQEFTISLTSTNMFLTIDIEYQIRMLLNDSVIRDALIAHKNVRRNTESMSDIQDGKLHRGMVSECPNPLTLNFNTDGAPLFHKSKRSFWPLQFILNDLPPTMRFKYVLMAGVMIVKKEPSPQLMNTYLSELVDQITALREKGIRVGNATEGQTVYVPIILCCSVDSVARPILQNRLQFNGYFGCSYCYQQGRFHSAMRYPFEAEDAELRTPSSHAQDEQEMAASSSLIRARGVKGPSVLMTLPHFNMVWGFPLDSMHTMILGVTKHLWDLLKKSLTRETKETLEKRLLLIRPPHDVRKLPMGMSNESNFKAKDWKSWILFYSIPVCLDYLTTEHAKHFALFVKCMYTLHQTCITNAELEQCEEDLMKFIAMTECLYSVNAMRYNIHSLLHAVESVRQSGPLWATSAFAYESNIYLLKKLVNGPKGVEQQIANKLLQMLLHTCGGNSNALTSTAGIFCRKLFSKKRFTDTGEIVEGVLFVGSGISSSADEIIYERCVYKGRIFHTEEYGRSKNWDDSYIMLRCGKMGQILQIHRSADCTCHLTIKELPVRKLIIDDIELPHIWQVQSMDINNDRCFVPITDVVKIVFIDFGGQQYVCTIPNLFEAD